MLASWAGRRNVAMMMRKRPFLPGNSNFAKVNAVIDEMKSPSTVTDRATTRVLPIAAQMLIFEVMVSMLVPRRSPGSTSGGNLKIADDGWVARMNIQ